MVCRGYTTITDHGNMIIHAFMWLKTIDSDCETEWSNLLLAHYKRCATALFDHHLEHQILLYTTKQAFVGSKEYS